MLKTNLILKTGIYIIALMANVQAAVLYVKPGNTSTAWQGKSNVYADLQSALNAASNSDEIWVAAGTYKPTSGTDRNISFNLKDGVAIYGGFAGNESQLSQRNWIINKTILSGEIGNINTTNDNSYCVVKAVGSSLAQLNSSTRLDGVIIEKGYAYNPSKSPNEGGGIYIYDAHPTIVNAIFRYNYAENSGGAVFANFSNSVFANTLFLSNEAKYDYGGAVYTRANLTFTHCTFVGNRSGKDGGGAAASATTTTINNSILWNNKSKEGESQVYQIDCAYSCIQGGHKGTGNINTNPLFVDWENGDFRLHYKSPCINSGTNSAIPSGLTYDFYGNTRLIGDLADMGIFEGGIVTPDVVSPYNNQIFPSTTTFLPLQWAWPEALSNKPTSYELELQLSGNSSVLLPMSDNSINILNLQPGTVNKWRIRGVDGSSLKNWSPWHSFIIKRPTPLFVKQGGTGNGTSWQTATGSLQAAIDAAIYGDEIWVAAGTYKPTSDLNREACFKLKNGVAIYGGFEGIETMLSQRNWTANPTILSGDIGVMGINTDNSFNVIKAHGTAEGSLENSTILNGLIIEDGYANYRGGGIDIFDASPTIVNCIFRNNYSNTYGGAVHAVSSNAVFANSLFIGNKSIYYGSAVYGNSPISFIHCTFTKNTATQNDKIIYAYPANISLSNCIVWNNGTSVGSEQFFNVISKYSCIEGGLTGVGNIKNNPLFIDAENGDCRLNATSPCINNGLNSETPSWLQTDYFGNTRLNGTLVDMGYSEGGILTPIIKTPEDLSVIDGKTMSTLLSWEWPTTPPAGITGYQIELVHNNGTPQTLSTTNTLFNLNNIVPNSTYKWRVRAVYSSSDKNWSPWRVFIVKHAHPIYVKPGGTGNGSTWSDAMGNLQTAIDAAIYGDEIWMAAGIYKPTNSTDKTISIKLKNGVALYGGFTGSETQIEERNWAINKTIVSGDISIEGNMEDNSFQVITAKGTAALPFDSNTRIDGIVIEGGYSTGTGAGLYIEKADLTVVNTVFQKNTSYWGAACYVYSGFCTFSNSLFLANKALYYGGAVQTVTECSFINCNFINNQAINYAGGAIYSHSYQTKAINCIAWGNIAKSNGQQFYNINCTYSCIEDGYPGTGNINSNPLFIDDTNSNFSLNTSSPCINKGSNSGLPNWLTTDFYGNIRLVGANVDMGMAESLVATNVTHEKIDLQKDVSVYPNPVDKGNPIIITFNKTEKNSIARLFNTHGKLEVEELIYNTNQYTFKHTNYTPGVYLLEIKNAEQTIRFKIIIK